MDWRKKVEIYEQIRREYEFGVGTIQGVARPRTKLGSAIGFIGAILATDRKEPRKQRHTAHRIRQRVWEEMNVEVAERTVRQYVQQRKRELGVGTAEVFIAQSYDWGQEAQVDRYEAWINLAGERVKLQVCLNRGKAPTR